MKKIFLTTAMAALLAFTGSSAFAYQATKAPSTATKSSKSSSAPSDADIAAAKARGDVWVNTSTKVYHKSDDKYYGKTKAGKFMAEADAQKAGYKLAGTPTSKKSSNGTTKGK